jgi:hypothetical protein
MLVLLTGRISNIINELAADASPVSVITFKFERMYLPATAMRMFRLILRSMNRQLQIH